MAEARNRTGLMSRALVLTVDPAGAPISGAELRNRQNAIALSEMGNVILVSHHPLVGPSNLLEGRIKCYGLTEADEARSPKIAKRRSSIDIRLTRPALRRLAALMEEFKPGIVLVEGIALFPYLEALRPLTPMLVLDMHNIESDLAKISPRGLRSRLLAPILGSESAQIRIIEREAVDIVDQVWVCSQNDRDRVRQLFGTQPPIRIIPNGIPRPDSVPREMPAPAAKSDGWPVILFVGHLGYAPNVEAARYLAKDILPLVRGTYPDARLLIAGRSPAIDIETLSAEPGVSLVANPDDMSVLYRKAHVTVVPLWAGGGTRIKVLEAMAHGLPVVATPLAVEGLDLVDGVEVLVADSTQGLADKVDLLCSDPERLESLRRNARQSVLARYGPAVVAAAVRNALSPEQFPSSG